MALDWKPVSPAHQVVPRDGKWLIIVPDVPNWMVTNFEGALLVSLCDGSLSISALIELLSNMRHLECTEEVTGFFRDLEAIDFFNTSSQPGDDAPLSLVYLNVTNRCNMRCPYCYISAGDADPATEMALAHVTTSLDEIHRINPHAHVVISGGEPLMREDVFEIASHIARLGLSSSLLTNGSLIPRYGIDQLSLFSRVQVSLDGSTPSVHERTRRDFSDVWNGIQALQESGIETLVVATINAHNYDDIPVLAATCKQRGLRIAYSHAGPFGRAHAHENLMVSPQKVYDLFVRLNEQGIVNGQTMDLLEILSPFHRRRRKRTCGLGREVVSIAANGDVFPCHTLHKPELKMGNVCRSALENILHSDVVSRVRVDVDKIEGCAACDYRYLCGGGCRAYTYWQCGKISQKSPLCDLSRICIEDNLFQEAQ